MSSWSDSTSEGSAKLALAKVKRSINLSMVCASKPSSLLKSCTTTSKESCTSATNITGIWTEGESGVVIDDSITTTPTQNQAKQAVGEPFFAVPFI
jgi:hypothetical protein